MRFFAFFIPILLWSCHFVYAQPKPYLRQYDDDDGLPTSGIQFHIFQSTDGFIWASGQMGMWRFNGHAFKNFSAVKDGVAEVTQIRGFEDYKHRLWFVGFSGRLTYYERGEFHPYEHNAIIANLIARNLCEAVHIDSGDTLHLGVYGKGYYKLSPDGRLEHVIADSTHGSGVYVLSVEDQPFVFYLSDGSDEHNGFPIYRFMDGKATPIGSFYQPEEPHFDGHNPRLRYLRRRNGSLVISWQSRLAEISDSTLTVHHTPYPITALMEDRGQGLWLSNPAVKGVYRIPSGDISDRDWQLTLSEKKVHNMTEDRTGGLWFTTQAQGISHIPYPYFQVIKPSADSSLLKPLGNTMNLSQGFYFGHLSGYEGRGVFHGFDGERIRSYQLPDATSEIRVLDHDRDLKKLYLASGASLFVIGEKGRQCVEVAQSSKEIRSIYRGKDTSDIWLSCDDHVLRVTNGKVAYRSEGLPMEIIDICFYEDTVYAGALNGLWKLEDSVWTHLASIHDGFSDRIDHLTVYDGALWVFNTRRGPVAIKGSDREVLSIPPLPTACQSALARGSVIKDGKLWCMIGAGRFLTIAVDPQAELRYRYDIVPCPTGESIQSEREIGCLDGYWLMRSDGELYKFKPNEYSGNSNPQLLIDYIKVNRKDYSSRQALVLPFDSHEIEIFLTPLSYNKKVFEYKYRMVGHSEWSLTKTPSIHFPLLKPGKYTFEATMINNHCQESPISSFSITVQPPYYKTWWFRSVIFLLFLLLIWFALRYRKALAKKRTNMLKELHTTQQMALASRMNPHFIFNSLSSIHQYTLENEKDEAAEYMTEYARLMRLVMENSGKELVNLENELEVIRVFLELEQLRCNDKISWSIEVDPLLAVEDVEIPALFLLPYIENAIWHGLVPLARPGGQLNIRFSAIENGLKVEIEDNGVGRDRAKALGTTNHPGFQSRGNNITESRISLINKVHNVMIKVKITDLKDGAGNPSGTKITLIIPRF